MTHEASINLNLCWKIEAKIVNVSASQVISIEVRYDFGREGQSTNDVLAQIIFRPQAESFELRDIFFNPWYQNHH
ncbi:hypothetical protein [Ferruginibacter sp.]|nr:hypothetical protein [Ferruginibacter sp.]